MTSRLGKIGDALSQLANVAFLPNVHDTTANESISGRAWRCGWVKTRMIIDFILSPWERNHCQLSYEADLKRAADLLKQANISVN